VGKRPLGRPRPRWEENVNMGLKELRWEGLDWIDLDQDMDGWRALVKSEMNLRVTQNARNFLPTLAPVSLSGRPPFSRVGYGAPSNTFIEIIHICHALGHLKYL
jgi:hypothetical protein